METRHSSGIVDTIRPAIAPAGNIRRKILEGRKGFGAGACAGPMDRFFRTD
jgi:hypothetical protein